MGYNKRDPKKEIHHLGLIRDAHSDIYDIAYVRKRGRGVELISITSLGASSPIKTLNNFRNHKVVLGNDLGSESRKWFANAAPIVSADTVEELLANYSEFFI